MTCLQQPCGTFFVSIFFYAGKCARCGEGAAVVPVALFGIVVVVVSPRNELRFSLEHPINIAVAVVQSAFRTERSSSLPTSTLPKTPRLPLFAFVHYVSFCVFCSGRCSTSKPPRAPTRSAVPSTSPTKSNGSSKSFSNIQSRRRSENVCAPSGRASTTAQ